MFRYSIYIVDDDTGLRKILKRTLEDQYQVQAFTDAETALEAMKSDPADLVLLDIGLPGMDGITALGLIKNRFPDTLIIMITAFEDLNTVLSAMKLGAHDYVLKPLHLDALHSRIRNALQTIRLRKEVRLLQERYIREQMPCFVGESRAIQEVMEIVMRVAPSPDTPVLILGETGTGKELIASAIHYRSPNFGGPFVPLNCAAIPRALAESEFFGYEPGSFTGAKLTGKKGLIEEATGGTLFLDEVEDLHPEIQGKLLRFLENGEYYRVGSTKRLKAQTRVISASNRNLEELVQQGRFRDDLYYRLGVIRIEVPSLSKRPEDILPLARYFLVEFATKFGKNLAGFHPKAERALQDNRWPGNIRELRNLVERAVLLSADDEVTIRDLGFAELQERSPRSGGLSGLASSDLPPEGVDLRAVMDLIEKQFIQNALKMTDGNENRAASMLHLKQNTLRYRKRRLGMP